MESVIPAKEAEVKAKDVGRAGLAGWRETVADKAAPPIAARTPIDEDSVRAAVGALFFVLSLIYVVGTIKRALARVTSA
jgi:hypothetical protein